MGPIYRTGPEASHLTLLAQPPVETEADYHAECDEKLADILNGLTASQQRRWKELTGEKVSFDRKRAVPYFVEPFAKYAPRPDPVPGTKGTATTGSPDEGVLPPPVQPLPTPSAVPVQDGPLPPPADPPPVRR